MKLSEVTGTQPTMKLSQVTGAPAQTPQPAPEQSFYDQLRNGYQGVVNNTSDAITLLSEAPGQIAQDPGGAAMEAVGAFNRTAMGVADLPFNLVNAISTANANHGIGSGGQLATPSNTFRQAFGIGEQGYMAPGGGQEVAQALGSTAVGAAGMVPVARVAGAPSSLAADFAGIGSTKVPFNPVAPFVSEAPISESQKQLQNLNANIPHANTAKIMLSPVTGKVMTDPLGKAATKQGFPDAMVASMKMASPDTRRRASEMVNITEKALSNETYRDHNTPLQVVGDSILDRVKVVYSANKVAGKKLGQVVESIKQEPVDIRPPLQNFAKSLSEMGIGIERTVNKNGETVFNVLDRGSTIDGLKKATGPLKQFVTRIFQDDIRTVQDAHRLKGYFDNILHYGKTPEGVPPALYNSMKKLRAEVNGVIGDSYPEYKKVNTTYADTINALDGIQDLAGKRVDLMGDNADKALGILARRVISNAGTNVPLRDALTELDATARKYITPGTDIVPYKAVTRLSGVTPQKLENDDLVRLVGFGSDMMGMFGTSPKNSMEGILEKGVKLGVSSKAEIAKGALDAAAHKLSRRNQANAIKAMRELLQRGDK